MFHSFGAKKWNRQEIKVKLVSFQCKVFSYKLDVWIYFLKSGTFQEETQEEIAYGLVHPLSSWDPIYAQVWSVRDS